MNTAAAINLDDYFAPTAPANDPPAPTLSAAYLRAQGLDWTVAAAPLATLDGAPVPGHFAIRREDTGRVLGVVQKGFVPVQNRDAFGILDPALADGSAEFTGAGSFKGGAIVWGQLSVRHEAEVLPGDVVRARLLISNGHDGSRALTGTETTIRVVCLNTLVRAERTGRRLFAIRHTRSAPDRVEWVRELVARARRSAAAEVETYRALARRQLTTAQIVDYLRAVVPDPVDPALKRARANAERTRDEVLALIEAGRGADIPGVRGSAWGAFNAVTEHVDHHCSEGQEPDARLQSIWYGTGAELKARALETILTYL
jgi:phage/plasmid-like protein (TIGR03299 family)